MLNVIQCAQSQEDVAQAEVFWRCEDSMSCTFSGGQLESVGLSNRSATALRVVSGSRIGASFGESPEQVGLLEDAKSSAAFGGSAGYRFASEQPTLCVDAFDPAIADLDIGELVEACLDIHRCIHRLAPDADPSLYCASSVHSVRVATTEGVDVEERSTRWVIRVVIPFADRGTDIGAYGLLLGRSRMSPSDRWIAELVEQRNLGGQPSRPRAGRLPVLLFPQVSNLLIAPLNAGLNGHGFADETSPLCGKMETPIFSKRLTILEDPGHASLFQPRSFDDEGIACRPRTILDAGVLTGCLTDLRSAERLQSGSTGNGIRRSRLSAKIDDPPAPNLMAAVIEPGDEAVSDLIAGIDDGLLVTFIRGLHSSNLAQGSFSVQTDGFHILDGKVAGYLTRTMIAGNIYEDFQTIRALSREVEPTAEGFLSFGGSAPYILLDSVNVTVG